jgi:hypothetical protein
MNHSATTSLCWIWIEQHFEPDMVKEKTLHLFFQLLDAFPFHILFCILLEFLGIGENLMGFIGLILLVPSIFLLKVTWFH